MPRKTWKLTVESSNLQAIAEALEKKLPAKILRCDEVGAPVEGAVTTPVRRYGDHQKTDVVVTWAMDEPR